MCVASAECGFILHLCMLVSFNSSIDVVYVHGVVFPYAWCSSRPLRRSEGWGHDRVVSELKVATVGLYGP